MERMETIIVLLNPNMTYSLTVDFGTIVLKCKNRVRIGAHCILHTYIYTQ